MVEVAGRKHSKRKLERWQREFRGDFSSLRGQAPTSGTTGKWEQSVHQLWLTELASDPEHGRDSRAKLGRDSTVSEIHHSDRDWAISCHGSRFTSSGTGE